MFSFIFAWVCYWKEAKRALRSQFILFFHNDQWYGVRLQWIHIIYICSSILHLVFIIIFDAAENKQSTVEIHVLNRHKKHIKTHQVYSNNAMFLRKKLSCNDLAREFSKWAIVLSRSFVSPLFALANNIVLLSLTCYRSESSDEGGCGDEVHKTSRARQLPACQYRPRGIRRPGSNLKLIAHENKSMENSKTKKKMRWRNGT